MDAEIVTVSAGGNTHAGFSEMELDAAFNHAVRTFWFRTAPSAARLKTFGPGTKVDIFFNGDLACRGFIDRVRPGFHYFSFSGRSIAQDLVDCAALDESGTGNFENQTLLQVGQSLGRQFGVNFATDQQLANIDSYQITPGETAFSAIEKLSREQGLTLAGQPDGSINITKPGSKRHAGGLFEGVNILFGEADLNWAAPAFANHRARSNRQGHGEHRTPGRGAGDRLSDLEQRDIARHRGAVSKCRRHGSRALSSFSAHRGHRR